MQFKSVFIAVVISTALIVGAFLLNSKRPKSDLQQPSAQAVRATGKCAQCHRRETPAVVHQYEKSKHAVSKVSCLDCHRVVKGQKSQAHRGFTITTKVTPKNCSQCHKTEHDQFMRSRHAAAAWAAVAGRKAFTKEQIAFAEKYHKGAIDRPANKLAQLEGPGAITKGCQGCHDIGKPNKDGSIGTCTHCHGRHAASVKLARTPATCGQCHMGPDHSQLEIYRESKHGALFTAQKSSMNLRVSPKKLTTKHMSVPTCATCHMSGLNGMKVTHDVTDRLSWYLFSPVSKKRPGFLRGRNEMKDVCKNCHTSKTVNRFYKDADVVVASTNAKVIEERKIMAGLRKDGLLTPKPFDEPIEFLHFDFWHYYGRTAKHAAFMGGADFVQWHGNYELLHLFVKIKKMAKQIRAAAAAKKAKGTDTAKNKAPAPRSRRKRR